MIYVGLACLVVLLEFFALAWLVESAGCDSRALREAGVFHGR
jgi:hypothetical protein